MTVDKCEFHGIKECVRLSDGNIELFVTTAFGPRIIGAGFCGGQNFFRIFDECFDRLDSGEWQIFGGHRLWHAPDDAGIGFFLISPRSTILPSSTNRTPSGMK